MPAFGLCLRLTHTGVARISLHLSDINDGVDVLGSFRKAGPVYVPIDGVATLAYTGGVAISFETGAIRGFIDRGLLTAEFVFGPTFTATLPSGPPSGAAGGDLGGTYPNPTVVDLTVVGEVQGAILYFNGANWVVLTPGVSGQMLATQGAGANPAWQDAAPGGPAGGDLGGTYPNPTVTNLTIVGEVRGAILYHDGTGWVVLTPGLNGQVLSTRGAGADPVWQDAAPASLILWGSQYVGSTTTTRYLYPGFGAFLAQTLTIQVPVTNAGVLRNLRIRHNIPDGNGGAIVYTLRLNGVGTAMSVSLASDAMDGADLVNAVAVIAGDLIDVEVTKVLDIGTSPTNVVASLEWASG